MRVSALIVLILSALLMSACSGPEPRSSDATETIAQALPQVSEKGNEVVFFAMGLIDTGYRFGGKNPEAGVDCSGMVSHIYDRAAGLKVQGSVAEIARRGRPIGRAELRPGDLVFFNTLNRSLSHVGIYIGDARFIHAPSTNGKVRIDRLNDRYFDQHFETARTYFD
jgi:cell wall-associated NlpC family hydrolase